MAKRKAYKPLYEEERKKNSKLEIENSSLKENIKKKYNLSLKSCFEIILTIIGIAIAAIVAYQTFIQTNELNKDNYLSESNRLGQSIHLMSTVLDRMNDELSEDYNSDGIRNLSPQLIGRIASLSQSMKPHKYLKDGKLIKNPLSPERGHFLLALTNSRLDSLTYDEIFMKSNFKYSDLKDSDLSKAYLKGANLSFSDFRGSLLIETNFKSAELVSTNFKYSKLHNAIFESAVMYKSDFFKTTIDHSNFHNSLLSQANFTKSNLLFCTFADSYFDPVTTTSYENNGSVFYGSTIFNFTYFDGVKFDSSYFRNIQFDNCVFNRTNFINSNDLIPSSFSKTSNISKNVMFSDTLNELIKTMSPKVFQGNFDIRIWIDKSKKYMANKK